MFRLCLYIEKSLVFKIHKCKILKKEVQKNVYLPRFSADAFISPIVRGHRGGLVGPGGLFPVAFPGECRDWLLCLRIVGNRATNDALCLKLEDARLISDIRFVR